MVPMREKEVGKPLIFYTRRNFFAFSLKYYLVQSFSDMIRYLIGAPSRQTQALFESLLCDSVSSITPLSIASCRARMTSWVAEGCLDTHVGTG